MNQLDDLAKIILVLVLCLLPSALTAGETQKSDYVIKKGDTLWDISSDKLKNPFQWKRIWKLNPYIKNPDLIYPGQKLTINNELTGRAEPAGPNDEDMADKLERIRVPEKAPAKQIPITKQDYIVSKEILVSSGYISESPPSGAGRISASPEHRILLGRTDFVYISTEKPAPDKTKFYILSSPERIIHPVTGNPIGYLVRIKGVLETVGTESGNTKALILESFEEILKGDILTDYYSIELPLKPAAGRRPLISGIIAKVHDGNTVVGPYSAVYLDKGSANGIAIGDLFTVITGSKPNIPVGTVQVITVQDKTSVAIVQKATNTIGAGDLFKN